MIFPGERQSDPRENVLLSLTKISGETTPLTTVKTANAIAASVPS